MGKKEKKTNSEIRSETLETVLMGELPRDLFSARLYWLFQEEIKEKPVEEVVRNVAFTYLMVAKNAQKKRAKAVCEVLVESLVEEIKKEMKSGDKSDFALFSGLCVTADYAYKSDEGKKK